MGPDRQQVEEYTKHAIRAIAKDTGDPLTEVTERVEVYLHGPVCLGRRSGYRLRVVDPKFSDENWREVLRARGPSAGALRKKLKMRSVCYPVDFATEPA